MQFSQLHISPSIIRALEHEGYVEPTPIQAQAIPPVLEGRDLLGCAQTGTGKTAAFAVPVIQLLSADRSAAAGKRKIRALVLTPTRELAVQIDESFRTYGRNADLRYLVVYGGVSQKPSEAHLKAGVDVLVATPGRLNDLIGQGLVDLQDLKIFILDEADRMLDMGFIPDVRSIVNRLPPKEKRSTMLYSATLDDAVMRLASQWMEAPVKVEVESEHVATKMVKQIVYVVTANEKFTVLYNLIQQYPDSRMLIFCNRRNTTEDVAESLARRGIRCEMLSGDVNQNRRLRVLEDFREGKIRTVVATDVAGRGLHVDDIGFVVNFDFPYEPEDYVHRIGRTGRAGQTGTAISFADEDESFIIPDIEKFIGEELKCTVLQNDDPLLAKLPPKPPRHDGGGPRAEQPHTEQPRGERRQESARSPRHEPPVTAAPRDTAAGVQETAERAPKAEQPEPTRADTEPAAALRPEVPVAPAAPARETKPAAMPAPRRAPASTPAQPAATAPRRVARFSEEWVPGEK